MQLKYLMPLFSFYPPCKHQKISGVFVFSGDIERDQWYEMGKEAR